MRVDKGNEKYSGSQKELRKENRSPWKKRKPKGMKNVIIKMLHSDFVEVLKLLIEQTVHSVLLQKIPVGHKFWTDTVQSASKRERKVILYYYLDSKELQICAFLSTDNKIHWFTGTGVSALHAAFGCDNTS